ncbi:Nuclear transcription factor Y subunit C-4 [Tetrabaena socialis]|uniref:Nuclear transcription factor Y subunit C-4 n=1 Tax=Tetrabaena socialis TaxID=47790 RepID=A0A2J7ZHG2_9CHLO|nr:Nuclear transcription factor Y subunit C-4 [Tetrabaena socialis]|eukprot:PNG99700.1 Nuclear transcription factor Y subunit C-4 [Tetrabaena socialis]
MFILELTLRSWMHAEENKRRTLQRNDVAAAITKTDIFDFLVDIVPREDAKPEDGQATASMPPPPPAALPSASMGLGPRPQGLPGHPALGPGGLFFQMPPGALGGDPSQAAAAAAAMMRPPMPPMGVDPALMSMYQQQQLMTGQGWPHMAGLPPPVGLGSAAGAAAMAAQVQHHQMQAAAAAAAAAAGQQGQPSAD